MHFSLTVTRDNKEIHQKIYNSKFEAAAWLKKYFYYEHIGKNRYSTLSIYKILLPSKVKSCTIEVNDVNKLLKKF